MTDKEEIAYLLELLVEGREIATFYETEIAYLRAALAYILWDHSGPDKNADAILVDVANAIGRSTKRLEKFDEEGH